ncbi:MAG: precorrin-6A/cobalt-precorrin-6A reductase [Candidatus Tokpelaia sp. JSC188]|nr:MAG: precorrin-6A/cobalt-precorrin-6A reductase [Candidatus Tokpelaia sp. JSC188]
MRGLGKRVLLLGGTNEGYILAKQLTDISVNIITSLAGRTKNPRLPTGSVRIGGFGGVEGLANYLREKNIRLVIDVTHPFANRITENAIIACNKIKVPLIQLERLPWQQMIGDRWIETATLEKAAEIIPQNARVFLAIGRQHLATFSYRYDISFVARLLELPEKMPLFKKLKIIQGKPSNKEDESRFLIKNKIDCIVCRNSGGQASYGKIIAAREIGLDIFMVSRKLPNKTAIATSIEEVVKHLCKIGLIKE